MVSTPGFVSYDIEMDRKFEEGLKRAQDAVEDLRPALKVIATDFYRSQKAIFKLKSSGGYPDYSGAKVADTWKNPGRPEIRTRDGSKTAYVNYKQKKYGFTYPMLKATGALEESVTSPKGSGAIYRLEKQSIEIGTSISYGKYHQEGTKKMPMRKFLFIGPETTGPNVSELSGRLPRWLNILNTYVLRSMGVSAENAKGPKRG